MRRTTKFAALLAAGILALGACGSDSDDGGETGSDPTAAAPQSDIKVGMAYDVGGRGDQSFNDSAAAGLDQAKDEEFGMEAQESEAEDGEAETAREERLRTFADAGYDPIIAVGFAYAASRRARSPRSTPTSTSRSSTTPASPTSRTSPAWSSPRSRARSWSARLPR